MFHSSSMTKAEFQANSIHIHSIGYSMPHGSICFSTQLEMKLPMMRLAMNHCTHGFM